MPTIEMIKTSVIDLPTIKGLGAIALFSLMLALSDTPRFVQRTGGVVALLAGGAIATTLLNQDKSWIERKAAIAQRQAHYSVALNSKHTQEQQHLLWELHEAVLLESALNSQLEQLQTSSQTDIKIAQSEIAKLEDALGEKTKLATQMLTELEAEATNTFNQFSAKVDSQEQQINTLQRQVASLRAENAALLAQQTNAAFASAGASRFAASAL